MITTLLCLRLVWASVGAEPVPDDEKSEASVHAARGLRAYEAERWEEAAREFQAAYAADSDPQYVYAQANALRRAGRCGDAIPRYREFLASGPEGKTELAAQKNLAECEAQAEQQAPSVRPLPSPVVPVEPPSKPAAVPRDARTARPIARDPWAHALTWPGVAIAGVGGGLLAEAHARKGRAARAADELAYRDALQGAPTLSRVGIGLLATGAALVVAGILRVSILAARRDAGSPPRTRRRGAAALLPRWRPLAAASIRGVP